MLEPHRPDPESEKDQKQEHEEVPIPYKVFLRWAVYLTIGGLILGFIAYMAFFSSNPR